MIIDTSALVAIFYQEEGYEALSEAIAAEPSTIPAPVVTEFIRVAEYRNPAFGKPARMILESILKGRSTVLAFESADAFSAADANALLGKGMRTGGKLNMVDLMVYGFAKQRGEPILCTGNDFVGLDVAVHPASRVG